MKRFENIFRTLCSLVITLTVSTTSTAQNERLALMDSVEVGLLTCSPHNEVYSLYGHTALHWHDLRSGQHWVFNYGVFDFRKPHFVWRFIMGKTDYMLECTTNLKRWCDYYRKWGSSIVEQILDLTPTEKLQLENALAINLRNPVYRYNFFYDNCSTRPRNIIEQNLNGTVTYSAREGYDDTTFRQLIHMCTNGHPWTAFGNDLLLGVKADMKPTQKERQFLPENLCWDFDHATVDRQGETRPLVLRKVVLVPPGVQTIEKEFPLSPFACTLLLFIVSIALVAYELRTGKKLIWWDVVLMLASGLAGCILVLMIFSEHPATSINFQLLILNPAALAFIYPVVKKRKTIWFRLQAVLLLLALLGALWQDYAEGMEFVALSLLLRYLTHRNDK